MAIRQKLSAAKPVVETGLDRVWRMALARAARDEIAMELAVTGLGVDRHSLAELLELMPDHAFLAMLEGPGACGGLMALSPDVLAAMIEQQTMGRVLAQPAVPRRPTRTDAAMVAGVVDAALDGLGSGLATDPDLVWAGDYHYASFLEEARPLGLLLEDADFRVLRAEVLLGEGAKTGQILLALPAKGRGRGPAVLAPPTPEAGNFTADLGEQVMASDALLEAVLYRLTIPLSAVMGLAEGDLVPLPMAALDTITFEASGRRVAEGKLGQNRGMRAVRLGTPVEEAPTVVPLKAVG